MSSSHQCKVVLFHWSLNNNKSLRIRRTFLSILEDLNNDSLYGPSDFQLFHYCFQAFGDRFKCSSHNSYHCHLAFNRFLSFPERSRYVSFYSLSFFFFSLLWTANSTIEQFLFVFLLVYFLLIITGSGPLAWNTSCFYYCYFTHLRVFHIRVGWWFFTRVWVTATLKSPGNFLVFWSISTML